MALQYIKENGFINLCKAIKKKLLLTYRFLTYRQEMFYYAASLSFYTIFALIPMLFIIFSVLLAFSKFQDKIEDMQAFILSNILPTNAETMINFMHTFLENGSKMGIVGISSVFITSLLFFRN
uniref:YhjD/YihY/BrkB family envelope integrity protein n=1 Tax=uncultured Helicobacter sp. TaxID=175537 RepID=UPI0025946537